MARDPQSGSFNIPVVDEQTKRQAMRTPAPTRPASPASVRKFEETGVSLETPTPTATPTPTPTPKTNRLPEGFTGGKFPAELAKFFGEPPANIMGWKLTEYVNKDGERYYKLSISQKGEYGDAVSGSIEFGAPIVRGPNGEWTVFQGDYSTGSSTDGTGSAGTTGTSKLKTAEQIAADAKAAENKAARQSAYDLLYSEFDRYGLGSLVAPLKDLITSNVSPSEFTLRLRETEAYKKRFAANETRIKNGLRALSESEYIRNEDAYQEVMRRRGLPPEYYAKGDLGVQKGFDALLAGDVSSSELEDRIVTAQDRVLNANPEIAATLKQFYPGISNGDILAYALDPANAINQIKRKITAAEIGAAAGTYRLGITAGRAEQLAGAGITEATAQQGFKTISQVAPRAEVLAEFYDQTPYTQETAEREVFGLTGAREAEAQRKRLAELETRAFQGSAGTGAIARDRAGVL